MPEALLTYEQVSISYDERQVLHAISTSVCAGETLCIVGESGSGKTTLLKAAIGLLETNAHLSKGTIRFMERDVASFSLREWQKLRGVQMSLVFQNSAAALTPTRRVGMQLQEMLEAHEIRQHCDRRRDDKRAAAYSESTGDLLHANRDKVQTYFCQLLSHMSIKNPQELLERYPFELSGGINQRINLAMSLVLKPRVLLADEPTSALDVIAQRKVLELLNQLKKRDNLATVLVTHNIELANLLADTLLVLQDGCAVECGPAQSVLHNPQSDYTKELLAAVPRLVSTTGSSYGLLRDGTLDTSGGCCE